MSLVTELTNVTSAFVIRNADEFWNNFDTYCKGNNFYPMYQENFINAGFTKYICVFGVLIASRENYPDSNLLYAANTVAHLLDRNCQGQYDDIDPVRRHMYASWLYPCNTQEDCEAGDKVSAESFLNNLTGFKPKFDYNQDERLARELINEAAFRMVHQQGWARNQAAYSGIGNWYQSYTQSVSCRQMAKVMCTNPGWGWETVDCTVGGTESNIPRPPGNPVDPTHIWWNIKSDCAHPGCLCMEWFRQAYLMSIGEDQQNMYQYMPTNQTDMRAMMDTEWIDMVDNPQKHTMPTGPYIDSVKDNCYAANGISGEPIINGSGSKDSFDAFLNIWLLIWNDIFYLRDPFFW